MDTQELRLAILHKVISELGCTGKTRLQKLCYFLQSAFDVPTKYPFKMYHYGPYAEALETDMARLRLTGYIEIKPESQGYGFQISKIDDALEEWGPLIEPYKSKIDGAMEIFRVRPTSELELAATIHFVKNLLPDESKEEILNKVKALKPKFDESYMCKLHDELKEKGLLS